MDGMHNIGIGPTSTTGPILIPSTYFQLVSVCVCICGGDEGVGLGCLVL